MPQENVIIDYVETKMKPLKLNEKSKSKLQVLLSQYGMHLLKECVDTSFSKYITYDMDGKITQSSLNLFFDKIGGIAYNKSLSPIESQISHIIHIGKQAYTYWDATKARLLLTNYINELRKNSWSEQNIVNDLDTEIKGLFKIHRDWSQWISNLEQWINDIKTWNAENNDEQPTSNLIDISIFDNTRGYLQKIFKEAALCFDKERYTAALVMIRKGIEILIIDYFVKIGKENSIKNDRGNYFYLGDLIFSLKKETTIQRSNLDAFNYYKEYGDMAAHGKDLFTKKAVLAENEKLDKIIREMLHIIDYANWKK